MERLTLTSNQVSAAAKEVVATFHRSVIEEVAATVARDRVVVVGMAQNPHVKNVRKALDAAGIAFTYLEYGSYFSAWKERLAIKLWSGWPTFPQVFVKGALLGGQDLTVAAIGDGTLRRMLDEKSAS